MHNSIKDIIKKLFPENYNFLSFLKQRWIVERKTKEARSLNEKDYPDYLRRYVRKKLGYNLDLENPRTISEKVQWRKLYDRDPVYSFLSDKYRVRKWVEEKIGAEYLVPFLGCWKDFKDIDFDALPDQFVLKTNNGTGSNIVVKHKNEFLRSKKASRIAMKYTLHPIEFMYGLELHYFDIKPLIIAEQYLTPADGKSDLTDYKFYCFNGKPFIVEAIENRTENETVDTYDMKWNRLHVAQPPYPSKKEPSPRPPHFDEMVKLAGILSEGFRFVRVDFYDNNGIYFGEMTFTPASGLIPFDPKDLEYEMADLWDIKGEQTDYSVIFRDTPEAFKMFKELYGITDSEKGRKPKTTV